MNHDFGGDLSAAADLVWVGLVDVCLFVWSIVKRFGRFRKNLSGGSSERFTREIGTFRVIGGNWTCGTMASRNEGNLFTCGLFDVLRYVVNQN